MVTGLLGPQLDTDVFVNWHRGLDTPGEDPWLNGEIGAAEVNGVQGQGLMAQIKHFAGYNGTTDKRTVVVRDQALHELLLLPYELALSRGGAASLMCSYQTFRDSAPQLPPALPTLIEPSPWAGAAVHSWPLDQAHYGCEQPLTLIYVLRTLWDSKAFVGTDYGASHSANAMLQGDDREDPDAMYLDGSDPLPAASAGAPLADAARDPALDPSGSSCADAIGRAVACDAADALHVAGIPGPGCPRTGCGLAHAVINGTVPLAVFKQALARVLYQEERFGMLGCDNASADCANPGGVGADRSGNAPLPPGVSAGVPAPGTMRGDAAIVEKVAEEGAVLLKNEDETLPISERDLAGGIAVSGGGAEYLIASPGDEGSAGFADRIAINPLQQLQALSRRAQAFSYTPANAPTGQTVSCGVLQALPGDAAPQRVPERALQRVPERPLRVRCEARSGLRRFQGDSQQSLALGPIDQRVDFTAAAQRPLLGGRLYRWQGWIYIDSNDAYVFRIQHSAAIDDDKVGFAFDGSARTLVDAGSFYQGQYYGYRSVRVTPTNAGFIEPGLRNRQCALPPGPPHAANPGAAAAADDTGSAEIVPAQPAPTAPASACPLSPAVGWHRIAITVDARALSAHSPLSLRFAYSRARGDIADAARDAAGKAMALVFVNDQDRQVVCEGGHCARFGARTRISTLDAAQLQLIDAVAAQNEHTVVVLNTGTPVIVKPWIDNPHIRAVLNLWHAGQEGGTATARLLLGQSNPSGHTSITWPRAPTDTIYGYDQPMGLDESDSPGVHPERLDGAAGGDSIETQGIYSGYRYYDRLGLAVQFPFGFGLSYTRFTFSRLRLTARADGGLDVDFDVTNAGGRAGDAVAQVYVGPGPELPVVQQAVRSLRGFERLSLAAGERRHVSIALDRRAFQYWSEARQQWVSHGPRTISVGDADDPAHLPLTAATAF